MIMRVTTTALVAAPLLFPSAPAAAADELSPVGDRAFAETAGCAATASALLVSMVVDESASLRSTDPHDQRVGGILTAVESLSRLRGSSSGRLDVQANLSTFAAAYQALVPWGALDDRHAGRLRDAAQLELPRRDDGRATDYRQALLGAQRDLERRAGEVGGRTCKVLLWFTDGALDVDGATERARSELCTRGGIADAVRADGIAVIASALLAESGDGLVRPEQREQLRAVAEGAGEGVSCGTSPIPTGRAAGAYLRADSPGALRRLFAGVGARIAGGVAGPFMQCPGATCSGGTASVPVDRGIAGLHLVVDADPVTRLSLISPTGQRAELKTGRMRLSGATVDVLGGDGLWTVSLAFPSAEGGHVGRWSLRSQDASGRAAPSIVDSYYFWGARLVVSADRLSIGQESELSVRVDDAEGRPLPASLYQSFILRAKVNGRPVELRPSGDHYRGVVTLPPETAATTAVVEVSATAVSSPSYVALGPLATVDRVAAALPPSFPSFRPPRLDLPGLEGTEGTRGVLHLTGSDRGQTRACLVDQDLAAPEGAGRVTWCPAPDASTPPNPAPSTGSSRQPPSDPATGGSRGCSVSC
jgi:hypothetical protein